MDPLLEPPPTPPKKNLIHALQEKLAQSRFLTFSLLLHVVLVVLGGSVVLFKSYVKPPDFAPDGPLVGTESVVVQPPDATPEEPTTQTVAEPTVSAPTVSAIVSSSSQPTAFTMANIPVPTMKAIGTATIGALPKMSGSGSGKGLTGAMGGRAGGQARSMAILNNGGKQSSEKAVMAGLHWLKDHQSADGSWGPSHKSAMTGLALLCFLGHGELPESPEFGATVKKGLDWMLKLGTEQDGHLFEGGKAGFTQHGVYEHGIATYALGEYYTMTKDERYVELLKKAVTFIVKGQAPDGGWNYSYSMEPNSDTSVTGWQVQALKAAHLSELKIPGVDEALDKAVLDMKRVQGPKGGFGYRTAEDKYSLTGVGVLCTYFWKQDKDKVVRSGIEFMLDESEKKYPVKYKEEHANLYAWYYNTQACLMYGGTAWSKWNKMFQDEIATNISSDGSWPPTGATGGHDNNDEYGQYFRTTLCVLMLEVYYRYTPTMK